MAFDQEHLARVIVDHVLHQAAKIGQILSFGRFDRRRPTVKGDGIDINRCRQRTHFGNLADLAQTEGAAQFGDITGGQSGFQIVIFILGRDHHRLGARLGQIADIDHAFGFQIVDQHQFAAQIVVMRPAQHPSGGITDGYNLRAIGTRNDRAGRAVVIGFSTHVRPGATDDSIIILVHLIRAIGFQNHNPVAGVGHHAALFFLVAFIDDGPNNQSAQHHKADLFQIGQTVFLATLHCHRCCSKFLGRAARRLFGQQFGDG